MDQCTQECRAIFEMYSPCSMIEIYVKHSDLVWLIRNVQGMIQRGLLSNTKYQLCRGVVAPTRNMINNLDMLKIRKFK